MQTTTTKKREEELENIKKAKKEEKRVKIYKRILAVEQRIQGKKLGEIATNLSVCLDTVCEWMRIYEQGGLVLLRQLHYEGRRPSKLEIYKKQIKEHIKEESVRTVSELQTWIKETYSLEVELSWLFRFCKKNLIFHTKKHV